MGGTLVSLDTAGQPILGSNTIALQSGSAGGSGEPTGGREEFGTGAPPPSDVDEADAITTTLDDGQVITAGPAALAAHGGHDSDTRGSGHHDQRDSRSSCWGRFPSRTVRKLARSGRQKIDRIRELDHGRSNWAWAVVHAEQCFHGGGQEWDR